MKSITQVIQNLLKPYIDNHRRTAEANLASVETNASSSSKAYASGDYLILDDVLYYATSSIAQGAALVKSGAGANLAAASALTTTINAMVKDVYVVTTPSFSSLPQTFTAPGINANHRLLVDGYALVTPESSKGSDWDIETGTNSIKITGTFNGSTATTVKMTLGIPRSKTAT